MSLLLDAMKKSGEQGKGTGLTLEDHPNQSAANAALENSQTEASRAAGQTLFAAKKKKEPPRRRWKLGLVPTTFLICSTIGAGYGYYVWTELNPPAYRPAPRPAPVATAPIAPPPAPPRLVAAIAPEPAAMQPAAPAQTVAPPATETVTEAPAQTTTQRAAKRPPRRLTIKRQPKVDTITPALQDAWQAYQRGEYLAAAQGYHSVLAQDARNRDALLGLGAVAQQQGQDQTAQHYYRQVLLLDPRDPVALGAMAAYGTNEADTEVRLKQMLSEQPQAAALHYALGNTYADQSRWAEAQQSYFSARALEPANALFTFNLAVSLDHLGQSRLAADHYRQALELDSNNSAGFDHVQALRRLNELTSTR
ncbi:MAG: tetratricopeptide repeat protein [Gammaproteobacteria bacterium]|nr:tetratricopeptide repeat protein [Gammaproteobacteria bacterium]MBU1446840.1 tetratricopeptide repeat protein [Gammaproteobacteria bacterium]